ncbi:hemolysin family protein [Longimicrobium terrae]|uniref:CBS domain containing-hemolysin-like protein n=1 Tax=Longimicrobium terrae TaxID=1639882 RepID=A0A841GNF6_9BACT|nr:hemolysin family protein [Longimicrobium terrae]MBB4634690.1 CBS domain containing-hemolysin-like protein [Longimicrobium terrae]MBB6068420.1 CBS domain containing-hemolysin-like protein [Longimicrobium terrae]NNC32699.1 HlyC/CorC family transporter [Longimicrobium terrae]
MLLSVLVILVLIALTALYVAAEFAAVSVRRSRIRQRAEQGDASARRVLPYLDNPQALDRYIAACQIGITLTSLIIGAFGQAALAEPLAGLLQRIWSGLTPATALSTSAVVILVGLTVLSMVLSELVPKSLALQFPTQVALRTSLPMKWSISAFGIFIRFLNGSGALALRVMGVETTGHRHIHSPEEIDLLIAESRDGGLLEPDEHRRLRRALQLGIRPARHLMVPRQEIVGVDVDTPVAELLRTMADAPYTRLPVYRGDIEHVEGLLHTKDLFRGYLAGGPLTSVRQLMRPILMVHESVTADRLLTLMREKRSHLAIVLDEFGGVAGLVTLDDVLTEVMGEVADEFRVNEPGAERLDDGRVRLPGWMRLDQAEPWLDVLWDGDSDTVGGRVMEELGHVPTAGERVRIDGVEVEVEAVAGHAVRTILALPARPRAGTEDGRDG